MLRTPLHRKFIALSALASAMSFTISLAGPLSAQSDTQSDSAVSSTDGGVPKLDEATDLRFDADTPDELAKVIELCEEAIEAGLDDGGTQIARQLIAASAFDRAKLTLQSMEQARLDRQGAMRLLSMVADDLEKSIANDPALYDAYEMLASLRAKLNEPKKAMEVVTKVIDNKTFTPKQRSKALLFRATLQTQNDARLADLKKAIDLESDNQIAWAARIQLLKEEGQNGKIYEELSTLLENQPDNIFAIREATVALRELDREEDAMRLLTEKIEEFDDAAQLYSMRAEILVQQDKAAEAVADIDKAIDLNPNDAGQLLIRAQCNLILENVDAAETDANAALELNPELVFGYYLRSAILAQKKEFAAAIEDVQILVKNDPQNPIWLLQLAQMYQLDESPRKAITAIDLALKSDPENWQAYRSRGDCRLAIGEHVKAIEDYQTALDVLDEDDAQRSGLLNNLAWVLATSPEDEIRDGKRSIELGKEACELTEFSEAHILSTLAAGYAESGDFENAIKYAEKAVELGKDEESEQLEQLAEELDSYRAKKPWREKQETEENKRPNIPSKGGIDV
jgi:tetratricopeptide (TPR) repeat protein